MKQFIATLALTLASTMALAHPGGHSLVCKSASNSGSKQAVVVDLSRSNGTGWYAPTISVEVDGSKFVLTTPDEMKNYGDTFHDSPLGVITVTADNNEEKNAAITGYFSVVAIPSSVKAFDTDGNPVKWDFKAEKDDCNDSNGKAQFQGIFRGNINSGKKQISIDTQIMDCELTYDSGMAC
jgi:hypothetical protein